LPKRLLPLIPAGLLVQQILPTPDRITIITRPRQRSAACPDCSALSWRVHSRYDRTLGDLAWQGRPVTLRVQARRFRCLNLGCPRQTFAERLVDIAAVAARRTERLGELLRCVGLALGGEAGARLAERLAVSTSPDTLLRVICAAGRRTVPPLSPRVLAVDDWSWRRGHRCGTVLVDLERNAVVDLLPDRQAETLATWLRQHPGVEIIARDRAGAYADGARQGAPRAAQVADRRHLLRNLGDAMQALVDRHGAAVRRTARCITDELTTITTAAVPSPPSAPRPLTAAKRASQASFARGQARYEEAAQLRAKGVPLRRIAALLGAERKTVRKKPARGSLPAPYRDFLDRRWAEGCRNAAQLWRELVGLGFAGRPGVVRVWARHRRQQEPATEMRRTGPVTPLWQPPSSRRIAFLLTAEIETLSERERAFTTLLRSEAPRLAEAAGIARRLAQVLRRDGTETLQDVLAAAEPTLLANFAVGLRRDLEAVQAAADLPWTTSPAEGQINRIKTIKRSMYGRAGFTLLRARVLHAA
jgi:transposase